ncbi:uncharacterized protein LOC123305723 isoform X2 [Chrysoperla carnea]|uniref:uncharacterized protein LOC123305723 isoform X2 n=1 Tax=Chrysoperla carnea TaxID=189513 RepID=UPI001D07F64E|nr:uncharacterized protein LOC123305723 isoform X2 [Chrysoperla carnea]
MESELDEDGQCLRGLPCHRVLTSDKDNLTLVFNEMETHERLEEEEDENSGSTNPFDFRHSSTPNDYIDKNGFLPFQRYKYRTNCCYGLAMDLLENIAQELEFDFRLYIVADGLFGTQIRTKKSKRDLSILTKKSLKSRYFRDGIYKHFGKEFRQSIDDFEDDENDEDYDNTNVKWNGIVGDLVSGAAHMSFAALSVSSIRSEVIDFSAPFFFSGVSFLAAPQQKTEIPLFSFLLPFSTELWIAIFTSLNITAIAVAVYEWLSPFGLNPWGRQRSKNFSMSSALWVMWGLLCGHLVAFKAPKSWPNKFLINVWGGFSVIFVASYTANIAALIAGLFFHNAVSNYHDRSLLSQKVGAPMSSAAEYYVQRANRHLWDHMSKYRLENVEEGVRKLRNGSLDILIADTPILDYYRATDHGCKLQKIGDTINEDAYGVGMTKGFPLKDSISAVIAKYSSNGYMDILQEKWYGGLPCFKLATDMAQPRPLGVAAVAGVFISLGVGMLVGCVILIVEHLFYRYTLPILRHKPKGTIWRSRNIMFFSQKLYRFINCVELVSPHHAARELVHTIRQGQITSLFQKSVKRKEHEQRRRRKSKAQFFEMIQEIRRVQQEERDLSTLESVTEMEIEEDPDEEDLASGDEKRSKLSPNILRRHFRRSNPKIDTTSPNIIKSPAKRLFVKQLFSPRAKMKQSKSSSTLNVRRFSTDSVLSNTFNTSTAVGRRLSRDPSFLQSSPPDINSRRSSYLDVVGGQKLSAVKSPVLSIENISDCSLSDNPMDMVRKLSDVESIGRKLATLPKYTNKSTLNVLDNDLIRRKSDIILSSNNKFGSTEIVPIETAKSVHNIPDSTTSKQDHDEIQLSVAKTLSNDEIMRRNQMTIQQLQNKLKTPKPSTSQPQKNNQTNPHIRIEIEDTSKPPSGPPPLAPKPKKIKQRHRSLGDHHNTQNQNKHQKLEGHSQSLDSSHPPKSSPEAKKPSRLSNPSQNRRPSSSRSSSLEKSRPPPTSSRTTSLDQSQPHHSVPTRTSSLDTSQAHHPTPSTRTSSLDKSQSRPPPSNRTSSLDKSQSRPPSNRTSSLDKSQSRPPSSRTSSLDKSQNRRTTSLDKSDGRRSRRNSSRCEEHDLPPAPPPPNCSPRNSNEEDPA